MHYHLWVRTGRTFTMKAKRYEVRATAHLAGQKLRENKADRLVLQCEACPKPVRSKRKPIRWERLGALFGIAGNELQAAWRAERERE